VRYSGCIGGHHAKRQGLTIFKTHTVFTGFPAGGIELGGGRLVVVDGLLVGWIVSQLPTQQWFADRPGWVAQVTYYDGRIGRFD